MVAAKVRVAPPSRWDRTSGRGWTKRATDGTPDSGTARRRFGIGRGSRPAGAETRRVPADHRADRDPRSHGGGPPSAAMGFDALRLLDAALQRTRRVLGFESDRARHSLHHRV